MQFTVKTTLFFDQVRFGPFQNEEGIRSHHWITAFFFRFFGLIEDVKVGRTTLHLNKYDFDQWTKRKAQGLSCKEDCAQAPKVALEIICAAKYAKEADQDLEQESRSFSKAQSLLQKAIDLNVPKKSLYETRVKHISHLSAKGLPDFSDQIPHQIETINKCIKQCLSKNPVGLPEGKLNDHTTLLNAFVLNFSQPNFSYDEILKDLKDLGLTKEAIQKECGIYADSLLSETIQQKNGPESKLAVKTLKNHQTFVLYKTACMVARAAPSLLEVAAKEDELAIEKEEAAKKEKATKDAEQIKLAKDTAAKLGSFAEECFNKMEWENCIQNLEDAAAEEPDDMQRQKYEERALALKTLITWSTHHKIPLKDVKDSKEKALKKLTENWEQLVLVSLGPTYSKQSDKCAEDVKKIKTIIQAFLAKFSLESEQEADLSRHYYSMYDVGVSLHDNKLDSIPGNLPIEKSLIDDTVKCHAINQMVNVCARTYRKAIQLQQEAQTANEQLQEAIQMEKNALQMIKNNDFDKAVQHFESAKEKNPNGKEKDRLEEVINRLKSFNKWAESKQVKGPEMAQIEDKIYEVKKRLDGFIKNVGTFLNLLDETEIPELKDQKLKISNILTQLVQYKTTYIHSPEMIKQIDAFLKPPLNLEKILENKALTDVKELFEKSSCKGVLNSCIEFHSIHAITTYTAQIVQETILLQDKIQVDEKSLKQAKDLLLKAEVALANKNLNEALDKMKQAAASNPIATEKTWLTSYAQTIEKLKEWCTENKVNPSAIPDCTDLKTEAREQLKKWTDVQVGKVLAKEDEFLYNTLMDLAKDKSQKYSENFTLTAEDGKALNVSYASLGFIQEKPFSELEPAEPVPGALVPVLEEIRKYHYLTLSIEAWKFCYERAFAIKARGEEQVKANTWLEQGELETANAILNNAKIKDLSNLIKWKQNAGDERKGEIEQLVKMAMLPSEKEKFKKQLKAKLAEVQEKIAQWVNDWKSKNPLKQPPELVLEINAYVKNLDIDSQFSEDYFDKARLVFETSCRSNILQKYFPKLGNFEHWDAALHQMNVNGDFEKNLKKEMILAYHLYQKGVVVDQIVNNYLEVLDFETTYSNERLINATQTLFGGFKERINAAHNNWEALLKNGFYTFNFNVSVMLMYLDSLKKSIIDSNGLLLPTKSNDCIPALVAIRDLLENPKDPTKPLNPVATAYGNDLFLDEKKYSVFCRKIKDFQGISNPYSVEALKAKQAAVSAFLDLWFLVAIKILLALPQAKANPHYKSLEQNFNKWQALTPVEQMSDNKIGFLMSILNALNNLCQAIFVKQTVVVKPVELEKKQQRVVVMM